MVTHYDYLYILVTPAKNEEDSLEKCIKSVVNQSKIPSLWLIMDDGSTDETPKIIERAIKKYGWIKSIKLGDKPRDLGKHYSLICKNGFEFIISECIKENIKYNYIGLLDADVILDKSYYENLINKFRSNHKLGIVSGCTVCIINEKNVPMDQYSDIPSGAARLWRKACFEETGGYDITYSSDSVSTVKAKIRGWDTKRFFEYPFIQSRMTSSVEGLWSGWKSIGVSHSYLGYPFIFAILRFIKYSLTKPYYIGLAYIVGYTTCTFKKQRTGDKEILKYYKYTRPREIMNRYYQKCKNNFK